MSGRRSHVRFRVLQCPEGVFRVMRDVIVERAGDGEVVVISRDPVVLGEVLLVHVGLDDAAAGIRACVTESQPVLVDGSLRHRLRLQEVGDDAQVEQAVAAR